MRNNQPVNNIEHRMKPDDILVSKTDLKGKLTYANEGFCKISGMTEEELIGQPHNVVRHPDMPPEAFADLWATVKAGKPWTGYVKNRSADGGFYWVKACVAPEFDDGGRSIGYISVRTCPTKSEISKIEALYADVNVGRAKLPSTLKFSFIRSLKVKTKLVVVSVLSTLTMLGLLWMVSGNLLHSIDEDDMHLIGLEYTVDVRNVLEHLPQHRGLSNASLYGEKGLDLQIGQSEQKIDQAMRILMEADAEYAEDLETSNMAEEIQYKWASLEKNWRNMSPKESFEKHTMLVQDLIDLSLHVGGTSGFLTSDNISESLASRVLGVESLVLLEAIGNLRGYGTGLVAKGSMTTQEKEKLIKMYVSVSVLLEQMLSSLNEAIHVNNEGDSAHLDFDYDDVIETMARESLAFASLVKSELLDKEKINITPNAFFDSGSLATESILLMFDKVSGTLQAYREGKLSHDSTLLISVVTGSIFIILLTLALQVYSAAVILKPLELIRHVLGRIVSNDYSTPINKQQDNELGDVLDLIEITQSRLHFEIFEAKNAAEKQLELDKQRKEEERLEDLALANTFESEVGSLVTSLSENASSVYQSMEQLSQIADSLNQQSEDAQSSVSQSSDYVGTTAAAIEEMSISVASVVEQINRTLDISKQAVHEATNSASIMQELVTASEEIGSVVATISDIAEQTNLLALNASIEAARAGDAGRGFAVVAGEVKELANQTSQATGQIRSKVEHIQKQSSEAGDAISKIHHIIGEVNDHSSHVASAMDEQSAAIREMSSGAQYANSSMQEAQHSVGEVSSSATTVDDSAEENLKLVNGMIEQMTVVQNQVQGFVARLKG